MLKKILFCHHCDDIETFCEVHNQILLLKLKHPIAAVPILNCTFSCKHNQHCKLHTVPRGRRQEAGSHLKDILTASLGLPAWGG